MHPENLRFWILSTALCACGTHTSLDSKADKTQAMASSAGAPSVALAAASGAAVACGSQQCPTPSSIVTMVLGTSLSVGCCLDAASGTCGAAASAGAACEGTPSADERCPGVDLSALDAFIDLGSAPIGNTKVGCCTPRGQCGSDGTAFGRGCVENGEASTLMASVPLIGGLISIPAARPCAQ